MYFFFKKKKKKKWWITFWKKNFKNIIKKFQMMMTAVKGLTDKIV